MNKLICFIGKTSSGKTTLAEIISQELDLHLAISTTTRPIRPNETGQEYHFITDEEFNKLDFIEKREYKVYNNDIWYYGYTTDEFNHDNCIAIVDVQGFYSLRDHFGKDKVIPFYIYANEDILRMRLKDRGDNPLEINRRLEDDNEKFKSFIDSHDYYKICNEDSLDQSIEEIKSILNKIL